MRRASMPRGALAGLIGFPHDNVWTHAFHQSAVAAENPTGLGHMPARHRPTLSRPPRSTGHLRRKSLSKYGITFTARLLDVPRSIRVLCAQQEVDASPVHRILDSDVSAAHTARTAPRLSRKASLPGIRIAAPTFVVSLERDQGPAGDPDNVFPFRPKCTYRPIAVVAPSRPPLPLAQNN